MKKIFLLLSIVVVSVIAGLSAHDEPGQKIDDWAKQTALIFQDSADFFASLKVGTSSDLETLNEIKQIDDALESLLPKDSVDLQYKPDSAPTFKIASDRPNIASKELLPDLFTPEKKQRTSVKGEVFRDEEDKIIGGQVQLAIPADF